MLMRQKVFSILALLLIGATVINAQSINAFGSQSQTISSDQTCTSFSVLDGSTLTVNQGVTLTLNISNGNNFNLFDHSTMQLHGTLAGSVASGATWMDNTYINVYLSDGAKYTVTGLTCTDGDNYLRYYGYDAATDGHGTVSVTSGSTAVTASSIGYRTTTYTFTATPASGYHFVNWTKGAGGEELGTAASINVTCEQNGQYQVYANFEEDAPAGSSTPEPEQTETLLTTITATGQEQASYSTANVATVSFSHTENGSSEYYANWGWWGYGWIATVTHAEGYTITKCIFYDDADRTATDSEAPFVVETTEADKTPKVNGTPIDGGNMWSKGIKKIEVYGYETPAGPQMRTLTGVPQGWQVQAGDPLADVDSNADGSYSIEAGQPVLVVPSAEDKPRVKSVTLEEVQAPAPAGPTLDLATVTAATTVEDGYTVTGTLGNNVKISIADGATVTLDGVTINGVSVSSSKWAGITCLGDATIILSGTNTVKGFYEDYPGIFVPENKTLTIQGAGSLTASSNGFGAGIGGGYQIACGNIVIEGGTVNAQGGTYAAGIGGGNENSCGNISITGGTVNAQGGYNAAGIGSGSGDKNSCGNISITGGTITATGGNNYGAGIGSGYRGSCGTVSITGGTITATGGNYAAGIGSGYRGSCDNISITGGTITATGGNYGAGIGSGDKGSCGTVTITGGVTSVTATKGFDAPNSIGAGYNGTCGTVTIGGTVGAITTSPYTYTPGN